MSCILCTTTKPVLNCIENLVIGTLANSTAYKVYFKQSGNGRINMIEATSSNAGLLTVALDFEPNTSINYEVWVTLANATDLEDKETILISSIETTCLYVKFNRAFGDNSSITATSQTLTI